MKITIKPADSTQLTVGELPTNTWMEVFINKKWQLAVKLITCASHGDKPYILWFPSGWTCPAWSPAGDGTFDSSIISICINALHIDALHPFWHLPARQFDGSTEITFVI